MVRTFGFSFLCVGLGTAGLTCTQWDQTQTNLYGIHPRVWRKNDVPYHVALLHLSRCFRAFGGGGRRVI